MSQICIFKSVLFSYWLENEHLKTGTKGFLCRANGCVNVTLWLFSRIINHANVQKGLKTCNAKNILYIQVKLELSENLSVAMMQHFSCNKKAKF